MMLLSVVCRVCKKCDRGKWPSWRIRGSAFRGAGREIEGREIKCGRGVKGREGSASAGSLQAAPAGNRVGRQQGDNGVGGV